MRRHVLFVLLLMMTMTIQAQQGTQMALWPSGAPHVSSDAADEARVSVFLPDAKRATGRAVVICPGGGYQHLAWEKEGTSWAPYFNQQGIAVVVLKYRMPHGTYQVPQEDAEEAIRLVRRNAAEWHVNPNDVGIMGFSAGGHLAATTATHAADDAAPNFQILFYPVISMEPGVTHQGSHDNLLGADATKEMERQFSNEQQVTAKTSRAFIALSNDDRAVPPVNGVGYYLALQRCGVPVSLHVYPTGGHGWGILYGFDYHAEVMMELRTWLQSF